MTGHHLAFRSPSRHAAAWKAVVWLQSPASLPLNVGLARQWAFLDPIKISPAQIQTLLLELCKFVTWMTRAAVQAARVSFY